MKPETVHAVVVSGPEKFAVVDRPGPVLGAGEAVLRLVKAGICASDLAIVAGKNPLARYPLTLGHECLGVVTEVSSGAGFAVGDWATVYPSVGCGACRACREGRINHCPELAVIGINRDGGFFAEEFKVPVEQLVKIPRSLQTRAAALLEPLAVAVHVVAKGRVREGDRALIIGSGVIGLLTAQVARASGASEVVLVDRFEQRREVASQLGFSDFVLGGPELGQGLAKRYGTVDVVFDTVCTDETLDSALDVLEPGGTVVLVASPKTDAFLELSFVKLYRRELRIVVSRNYVRQDFLDAVGLLERGAVATEPLITAEYALHDFADALAALRAAPWDHVKVLLEP